VFGALSYEGRPAYDTPLITAASVKPEAGDTPGTGFL
jgi:hypothetical protein